MTALLLSGSATPVAAAGTGALAEAPTRTLQDYAAAGGVQDSPGNLSAPAPGMSRVHMVQGQRNGYKVRASLPAREEAVLSYQVSVPTEVHDTGLAYVDLKLPGLGGLPAGQSQWYTSSGGDLRSDSWSVRLHTRPSSSYSIGHPWWHAYVYAPYAAGQTFKTWGIQIPLSTGLNGAGNRLGIPSDRWFEVRMRVLVNTPGLNDGELDVWIDGQQGVRLTDVQWRPAGITTPINQLIAETFYNLPGAPRNGHIDMKDFRVATKAEAPVTVLPEAPVAPAPTAPTPTPTPAPTPAPSSPAPAATPTAPAITSVSSPQVAITESPAPITRSNPTSVSFTGTDPDRPDAALTYHCQLDGAAATACTSPVTYNALADGVHTVQVVAFDEAGNQSEPASSNWRVDTAAPTITAGSTPKITLGTSVVLSYSGADVDGSGVTSYDVRHRSAPDNGGFGSYVYPDDATRDWTRTTATSVKLPVTAGHTYCLSVRSRDAAGNTSSWTAERCTTVALDDRALSGTGWSQAAWSGYYKDSASTATSTGAVLERSGVRTRRISLIATTCSTCGSVAVYWNGTLLKQVSLVSSTTYNKRKIYVADLGSVKTGTLTIKTVKNARSTIDGVALRPR